MFTARLVLSSRLVRFHSVANTRIKIPKGPICHTAYFHNQQLRYFADKNSFTVQRFVDLLSRPIREFTDRDEYLEAIKNYNGDCIATCALTKTVDSKTVPSLRAYVLPRGVAWPTFLTGKQKGRICCMCGTVWLRIIESTPIT